jgi:hypothetical protein
MKTKIKTNAAQLAFDFAFDFGTTAAGTGALVSPAAPVPAARTLEDAVDALERAAWAMVSDERTAALSALLERLDAVLMSLPADSNTRALLAIVGDLAGIAARGDVYEGQIRSMVVSAIAFARRGEQRPALQDGIADVYASIRDAARHLVAEDRTLIEEETRRLANDALRITATAGGEERTPRHAAAAAPTESNDGSNVVPFPVTGKRRGRKPAKPEADYDGTDDATAETEDLNTVLRVALAA